LIAVRALFLRTQRRFYAQTHFSNAVGYCKTEENPMTEEDTMRAKCIENIQSYTKKIQDKSRELSRKRQEQEQRLLLGEIINLAQDVQKECSRFPLPY
jgi:hypothetical protein